MLEEEIAAWLLDQNNLRSYFFSIDPLTQNVLFRELIPAQVLREAAWPIEQESWEGAESQWEEGNKELHILCKLWVSCECFPSTCVIPDPFLPEQVRQALEKGNQDVARIYAENAIRKKSESLNYLRMSGKVDAVAGRVKSAQVMKGVSKNMGSVVKSLDKGWDD